MMMTTPNIIRLEAFEQCHLAHLDSWFEADSRGGALNAIGALVPLALSDGTCEAHCH